MLIRVALVLTGLAFVLLWVWFWFYSGSTFTLAPYIGFSQIVVFLVLSKNYKRDFSFTTVVQIVLMAGVLGVPHLKDKDWSKIRKYVEKNQINLDAEGVTDNFVNSLK